MISKKLMRLYNSEFRGEKTFRMLPVSLESPFTEVIYAPKEKVLAVVGKNKKQSYSSFPKLDEYGTAQMKQGKYLSERKIIDVLDEYELQIVSDIEDFIETFADNATSFDYKKFLV